MLYNDQQARLVRAFCRTSTCCATTCTCGRTHFTSARGHGDYEEGELEELQAKALENPNMYIEDTEYDSIDMVPLGAGAELVPHCPCEKYKQYCNWIEAHAPELTAYLLAYLEDDAAASREALAATEELLHKLGPLKGRSGSRRRRVQSTLFPRTA